MVGDLNRWRQARNRISATCSVLNPCLCTEKKAVGREEGLAEVQYLARAEAAPLAFNVGGLSSVNREGCLACDRSRICAQPLPGEQAASRLRKVASCVSALAVLPIDGHGRVSTRDSSRPWLVTDSNRGLTGCLKSPFMGFSNVVCCRCTFLNQAHRNVHGAGEPSMTRTQAVPQQPASCGVSSSACLAASHRAGVWADVSCGHG
jgi:hypothetical protein